MGNRCVACMIRLLHTRKDGARNDNKCGKQSSSNSCRQISEVDAHAGVEMAHDGAIRTLEGPVDAKVGGERCYCLTRHIWSRGNSRRSPREPHQALARNDVPAREQHGRVLRRRLFLRDGARKDRVVAVRQRERDLDLRAWCVFVDGCVWFFSGIAKPRSGKFK